ncbi:unnamed protein product [Prunus brigantina]
MVSPWPFAQWGLDLIGPMPEGKGQVKYAVVAVDYFTKFKQFCSNLKIKLCFATPAHPQSNGQVEAVNKIIKKTLKTKLDKAKGCWPELLPEVLWSYRTTFRTSTGETPFSLSFGTEAVAPVEIGQPTYRTSTYEAEANDEQLALNLDFIDELRDQSNMRNIVRNVNSQLYGPIGSPAPALISSGITRARLCLILGTLIISSTTTISRFDSPPLASAPPLVSASEGLVASADEEDANTLSHP